METTTFIKNMIKGYMNLYRMTIGENNIKIRKLETDIADEPTDQLFKDRCGRKIQSLIDQNEQIQNFIDYVMKYEIDGVPVRKIKKPYDSFKRARGFCLLLLLKKNETTPEQLGMTKLKKFSKKWFPEQSDQTMYKLLLQQEDKLTLDQAQKYQLDYDYGLMLFNLKTSK
jgi:hypothetical protein